MLLSFVLRNPYHKNVKVENIISRHCGSRSMKHFASSIPGSPNALSTTTEDNIVRAARVDPIVFSNMFDNNNEVIL
jgi:molybdopterin biosynthesis enzyme MoaB